jgi:hypothetical protein
MQNVWKSFGGVWIEGFEARVWGKRAERGLGCGT